MYIRNALWIFFSKCVNLVPNYLTHFKIFQSALPHRLLMIYATLHYLHCPALAWQWNGRDTQFFFLFNWIYLLLNTVIFQKLSLHIYDIYPILKSSKNSTLGKSWDCASPCLFMKMFCINILRQCKVQCMLIAFFLLFYNT